MVYNPFHELEILHDIRLVHGILVRHETHPALVLGS